MTIKEFIAQLETFPQDAIVVADDGTGWLAMVEKDSIYTEEYTSTQEMIVIATGGVSV